MQSQQTLFVVPTKDEDDYYNYFLGFTEEKGLYNAVGIYKVAGSAVSEQIEIIFDFTKDFVLANNRTIELLDFNGNKFKEYIGKPNNRVQISQLNQKSKAGGIIYDSYVGVNPFNNYAPKECFDYYWVTYDENTGKKISEEYLYTDCSGGGGGQGGSIPVNYFNANTEAL